MFKAIFTWWNGATLATRINTWLNGRLVGEDEQGNRYYEQKKLRTGQTHRRRWVIYNGLAEATRVPADWHAWLHHIVVDPPTTAPFKRQPWEKDHKANPTGTPCAHKPGGSLGRDGQRPPATGDYEAWTPGGTDKRESRQDSQT